MDLHRRLARSLTTATDSGTRADAVQSAITGMGVLGEDKSRDARPADPVWLGPTEMENLSITDVVIRRAIYVVPEDATAEGWRTDDGAKRDTTADLDARLLLEPRLTEVASMARQYGGAHLLMVCEGVQDLTKPLPPGPHNIVAVHVLTGREAYPQDWDADWKSANWSNPLTWTIAPIRPGTSWPAGVALGSVHRSHMVYVPGLPRSPSRWVPLMLGYDLSVPQVYWEAVRDLGLAMRSTALALMEQSMMTLQLKGGQAAMVGSMADDAAAALELWSKSRSTMRANVLMGDDTAQRLDVALPGYADAVRVLCERLAAAEGIPLTVLLGIAPAGLSSDDESARRTYARFIRRYRRLVLNPALLRLYEVALGPSAGRHIEWPDVDQPTAKERAELSKLLADRDAVLLTNMVITPDEARARLNAEDGDAELVLPVIAPDSPAPEPTPEDLAALAGIEARTPEQDGP